MSKISTYDTVVPTTVDKVIGTDIAGTPADATKNFTAGSIAALAARQGVLNLASFADNNAAAASLPVGHLYRTNGAGSLAAGIVMVVV